MIIENESIHGVWTNARSRKLDDFESSRVPVLGYCSSNIPFKAFFSEQLINYWKERTNGRIITISGNILVDETDSFFWRAVPKSQVNNLRYVLCVFALVGRVCACMHALQSWNALDCPWIDWHPSDDDDGLSSQKMHWRSLKAQLILELHDLCGTLLFCPFNWPLECVCAVNKQTNERILLRCPFPLWILLFCCGRILLLLHLRARETPWTSWLKLIYSPIDTFIGGWMDGYGRGGDDDGGDDHPKLVELYEKRDLHKGFKGVFSSPIVIIIIVRMHDPIIIIVVQHEIGAPKNVLESPQ